MTKKRIGIIILLLIILLIIIYIYLIKKDNIDKTNLYFNNTYNVEKEIPSQKDE